MEKSLWKAIGSASPLLEMMVSSYSPDVICDFSMGQVDISEVKSGWSGTSEQ